VLGDPRFSNDVTRAGFPDESAGLRVIKGLKALTALDNPLHNELRRMQSGPFRIKEVEARRPRIQTIVDAAIDGLLASGPPVDLVEGLARPVPSFVTCELVGIPFADQDFFHQQIRGMFAVDSTTEEAMAALGALKDYMEQVVEAKNAQPSDDVISRLVVEQLRSGVLTAGDIVDQAIILAIAGLDTTVNAIALGTLTLLQHPDQLKELRETSDGTVVAGAVEELLRYTNVLHFGRRRVALEDVEVGGQLIRAGEGVIGASHVGDRDDEAFPMADTVDIHREAKPHLTFGFGTHQCLGQTLARVELQVVFGTLFRRIPTLKLAVPLEDLRFKHESNVYGLHELPVRW
jgi:cytochrome P450